MAVFFDLDDTLLDSRGAVHAAVGAVHASLASERPLEVFLEDWAQAHARHYPRYLKAEISFATLRRARVRDAVSPELDDAAADALFDCFMSAYERAWKLFPDVEPALDALRDRCLGVISNGPSREQRRKLARLGLAERLRHVLISEEAGHAKPDPRIFERACELAGCPPSGVIFVGDNYEIDVQGAVRAGLRGIWLRRMSAGSAAPGSETIGSLHDLVRVLGGR